MHDDDNNDDDNDDDDNDNDKLWNLLLQKQSLYLYIATIIKCAAMAYITTNTYP